MRAGGKATLAHPGEEGHGQVTGRGNRPLAEVNDFPPLAPLSAPGLTLASAFSAVSARKAIRASATRQWQITNGSEWDRYAATLVVVAIGSHAGRIGWRCARHGATCLWAIRLAIAGLAVFTRNELSPAPALVLERTCRAAAGRRIGMVAGNEADPRRAGGSRGHGRRTGSDRLHQDTGQDRSIAPD